MGVFVETNVIFLRMVGMFTIFFLYFFKGWSSGKFTGNHSVVCLITFTQRKRYYSASLNFKSLFVQNGLNNKICLLPEWLKGQMKYDKKH